MTIKMMTVAIMTVLSNRLYPYAIAKNPTPPAPIALAPR